MACFAILFEECLAKLDSFRCCGNILSLSRCGEKNEEE